jgi:hypothetical protein
MSVLENISIPEPILSHARKLAEKEGITLEQFISSAMAEKVSAWTTLDYLRERAARGSRGKFFDAFRKVLDVEPDEEDRLD